MLPTNALPKATANGPKFARRAAHALALAALSAAPMAALILAASPAFAAEPASKKVIAVYVEGQDASTVRADIEAALPDRVTAASAKDFSAALKKTGQTKPFGSAMTNSKGRGKLIERAQKAASDVGASAVIVGVVQRWNGKRSVYLVWVNADGSETPVDERVMIPGEEDERRSAIKAALGAELDRFAPPETTEKKDETAQKPVEKKDDEETSEEKPARVRHEAGSALLSIEAGFEAGARSFSYSDGLVGNLRDYNVLPAPLFSVGAEIYPAAWTTIPVLRDVGLTVSYARAFALQSAVKGGEPLTTVYQRLQGGLRVRVPFSRPTGPVLGVNGGVLWQTFRVDVPKALEGQVANAEYLAIRAGLDGRIPVGRVAFLAGFEWLEPLSSGEVYERFSGPKVHGIEAMGGFVVRIASGFELRLIGEYRRFFSDFDPVLGDAYVAGGALDQFFGLRLAGAYIE